LLALYVACWHRGILDFFTGGKILLQGNVDRHHILPRSQFPESKRSGADIVANIAFVTEDVNKSIGQSGPEVYLKQLKTQILKSQCVPTDSNLWYIECAKDFWQARCSLLADAFNDYVREALPGRRGLSG
jgi:hypothetical protein